MNSDLEKYILDHTTREDPVLEELFRQTHLRFVNPNRVSGHIQGKLLEMISRMINPFSILEIGTFTGYSAICLAKGLKPGGTITTIEADDELDGFSEYYFRKSGMEPAIKKLTGRLQDLIGSINDEFDLVFIDGDKREYTEYYNLVFGRVRHGGYIIADNILWGGKVLENGTRDPQTTGIIEFNEMISRQTNIENIILPVRDGLMIIRKL
jgi:predicted O-methyltransferase YrrM